MAFKWGPAGRSKGWKKSTKNELDFLGGSGEMKIEYKDQFKFTDEEKESIRKFADSITPKRWNMCSGYTGHRDEPGILNIHLFVNDYEKDDIKKNLLKRGWTNGTQRTTNSYRRYETVEITINPHFETTVKVIIHELAHTFLSRYWAYKHKCDMRFGDFSPWQEHNSKEFKKAVKTLEKRAERYFSH